MRLRAFIFDDKPSVRKFISHLLQVRGYEVYEFSEISNCPLFLHDKCVCHENSVCCDIAIADAKGLKISGLEFMEHQIKKGCKIPHFAIVSSYCSELNQEYAEQLKCKIFQKPFTVKEFYCWLDSCEKQIDPERKLSNAFRQKEKSGI